MLDKLPAFAICGGRGSGKTTLIERIIPLLGKKGLQVAVLKHNCHGIDVDRPGKDSDRFFEAGADVLLQGSQQQLTRIHQTSDNGLSGSLISLLQGYDLVLVEGHKSTALPKVWLSGEQEKEPPGQTANVLARLGRDSDRVAAILGILEKWLVGQWLKTPLFGSVLIGGSSRRLGEPKHLLRRDGRTWLEQTVELLQQVTDRVVIVGAGVLPKSLQNTGRLPDVPDAQGPMAGILAAMRWAPQASWLVAACDLPQLSVEALRWLLRTRAPGVWATLPRLTGKEGVEPLLAHYDLRSGLLLQRLADQREFSLAQLAGNSKVISPSPPAELAAAWKNINTASELASYMRNAK